MNPFDKPIGSLEAEDIAALITNASEGPHLDFKRTLPNLGAEKAKSDLLDDVSAFANGRGGCIVYGIREKDGVAAEIVGVGEQNFDRLKLRIEELVRSHIYPRIAPQLAFRAVEVGGKAVFILYARQSWRKPHMVSFPRGNDRFKVRTAAGNRSMDVDELRAAFLGGAGVEGQIRAFRSERLSKIVSGDTPYPLIESPIHALHVVPYSAFDPTAILDASEFEGLLNEFYSVHFGMADHRHNLDGFVMAHGTDVTARVGYAQLFRSGVLEFVSASFTDVREEIFRLFPLLVERNSFIWTEKALSVQRGLGIDPPVFVSVSLLGVRGCRLSVGAEHGFMFPERRVVDRDDLLLDPVVVESFDQDPKKFLQATMDAVWQAAGWSRSLNYKDGNWTPRR